MNEAAPNKKETLRGTETLSPELALTLREAVQKFTTAYKIRQAAGYDYKPSNAVDGNFALRMQYGQLREEVKQLGRRLDAGETLEEDDYIPLVKKQAAFDRSYEKVLQYAAENNINIDDLTETGEEATTPAADNATIGSNMETTKQSVATTPEYTPTTKPQLDADRYESGSLDIAPEQSEVANGAAKSESEERVDPTLSPELKQALLNKLTEYEARVEAFRKTLTDTAVESHASYDEFKNKSQKLRALLRSNRNEAADAVVKQQIESLQPRLDAMHQEITSDLQKQREDFETWVGPELTQLRNEVDMEAEDVAANSTEDAEAKKTGWFDPAFRRARGVDTAISSNNKTDTTEPFVATEAMRVDADTKSTEPFVTTEAMRVDNNTDTTTEATEHGVGEYPTDPSAVLEFKQEWQQAQEETTVRNDAENESSEEEASAIGNYPDSQDAVPEFAKPWQEAAAAVGSGTSEETTPDNSAEQPRTIIGLELPTSGPAGAAAIASLKQALSKMLLIQDAKTPGREKKAVHQAWGILHAVSPEQGMSAEQRQQLAELANDLPQTNPETALAEVRAWQELDQRLPDLSDKLNRADEVTKSNWRRRGKQMLLVAAVVFGSATPTSDQDPTNADVNQANKSAGPSVSGATDGSNEQVEMTSSTGVYTPVAEDVRNAPPQPEAPGQATAPAVEQDSAAQPEVTSSLETDSLTAGDNDNTVDTAPDIQSAADATIEQRTPTTEALPSITVLLDTMLERQEIPHTFIPGSKVNTVSEAMWETWKQNSAALQIEEPISKTQFLKTMWEVVETLEKRPALHAALTEKMGINSGDIHKVFDNETIDLLALFKAMEAELKELPNTSSI